MKYLPYCLSCLLVSGLGLSTSCRSTQPGDGTRAEGKILAENDLEDLAAMWARAPSEALFYAMGDQLAAQNVPEWESKQLLAMKYFGTPIRSSMLAQPHFLEYVLPDGRSARIQFSSKGQKFSQRVDPAHEPASVDAAPGDVPIPLPAPAPLRPTPVAEDVGQDAEALPPVPVPPPVAVDEEGWRVVVPPLSPGPAGAAVVPPVDVEEALVPAPEANDDGWGPVTRP